MMAHVPVVLLSIQLPIRGVGKQWRMAQIHGLLCQIISALIIAAIWVVKEKGGLSLSLSSL